MSYLDCMPFYVYKIVLVSTGEYYYGSRYNHVDKGRAPCMDLWLYYFTSSDLIKRLIKQHGKDQFKPEIIYTSLNREEVFWTEQDYIRSSINDPLCLNKRYFDSKDRKAIFCTSGLKRWVCDNQVLYSKEAPGEGWVKQGRPHTEVSKKRIGIGHAGKPKSESHKQSLSKTNSGRTTQPCKSTTKQILKNKNTGLQWWNNGQKHVFVHECPGEGWVRGALPKFTEEGMARHKENRAGRVYWHNMKEQKMARECPGEGWIRGRLYYRGKRVAGI